MVKFEVNIKMAKLPKLDHFYFFERYRFDFFLSLTDLDSASKDHSFLFFYLSVWTEASAATTAPPSATTAKQGKQ